MVDAGPEVVLVVEDDAVYREALGRALVRAGYLVVSAGSLEEAEASARRHTPDRAVVDLKLGDGSGIDLLPTLRELGALTVILTGHGTIPSAVEAMRGGAVDFLTKPVSTAALLDALARAPAPLERGRLDEVEDAHIRRTLQECDGNISEAARRLGLHRRTLQRRLRSLL